MRMCAVVSPVTVVMSVPGSVRRDAVNVYMGLFDPGNIAGRAPLAGSDSQSRILAGRLHLKGAIRFEKAIPSSLGTVKLSYTRSDGGWAEGFHRLDAFLKNTHEVLGPLHAATAHDVLTRLGFLTADRTLRRATYGSGPDETIIVVNFGTADAEVTTKYGGRATLPPWGFVVEAPRFTAFCARGWGGRSYPGVALFTLRAFDAGATLSSAKRVHIFHGFGDATVVWKGTPHEVKREEVVNAGAR